MKKALRIPLYIFIKVNQINVGLWAAYLTDVR